MPFDKLEHYHIYGAAGREEFDFLTHRPPVAEDALPPGCFVGDLTCAGYDRRVQHDGWFYDLADLNQEHPFVRSALKWWTR